MFDYVCPLLSPSMHFQEFPHWCLTLLIWRTEVIIWAPPGWPSFTVLGDSASGGLPGHLCPFKRWRVRTNDLHFTGVTNSSIAEYWMLCNKTWGGLLSPSGDNGRGRGVLKSLHLWQTPLSVLHSCETLTSPYICTYIPPEVTVNNPSHELKELLLSFTVHLWVTSMAPDFYSMLSITKNVATRG